MNFGHWTLQSLNHLEWGLLEMWSCLQLLLWVVGIYFQKDLLLKPYFTHYIYFFLGNLEFRTTSYDQGSFVAFLVTLQVQKHKTFGYA
jgi:hypothetical protein